MQKNDNTSTMSDEEESFIILDSMDALSLNSQTNDSILSNAPKRIMEMSTQTANGYSLVEKNESLKSESANSVINNGVTPLSKSLSIDKENIDANNGMTNSKYSLLQETLASGKPSLNSNDTPSLIAAKVRNSSIKLDNESVASKFILGAIDGDSIKSGMFSNFPSLISKNAHPDDIHKFQNLIYEHKDLREQLQKTNIAMRQQYTSITKWQDEVKAYQQQMADKIRDHEYTTAKLKEDHAKLTSEHAAKEKEHDSQMELMKNECDNLKTQLATKVAQHDLNTELMKKENFDLAVSLSEKTALIQNLTEQIKKLEAEKENYVFIQSNSPEPTVINNNEELENVIKVYKSELSSAAAKNLELEDMKSVYIDELNCLRVNLIAAEELHQQLQLTCDQRESVINERNAKINEYERNAQKMKQEYESAKAKIEAELEILRDVHASSSEDIKQLTDKLTANEKVLKETQDELVSRNKSIEDLQKFNNKLKDEIAAVTAQGQVFREDFETERKSREQLVGEKDQLLATVQQLQNRNQELVNQSQANIRATAVEDPVQLFLCPLCNKSFRDFRSVELHAQDCDG